MSVHCEEGFGCSQGISSLNLTWEDLTYNKVSVKLYEHSGAKPTPLSTFKLRYELAHKFC